MRNRPTRLPKSTGRPARSSSCSCEIRLSKSTATSDRTCPAAAPSSTLRRSLVNGSSAPAGADAAGEGDDEAPGEAAADGDEAPVGAAAGGRPGPLLAMTNATVNATAAATPPAVSSLRRRGPTGSGASTGVRGRATGGSRPSSGAVTADAPASDGAPAGAGAGRAGTSPAGAV